MNFLNDKEKNILFKSLLLLSILAIFYLLYYKVAPAFFVLCKIILPVFTPFIIAFIIAEILRPCIDFFEKKFSINRNFSIIITLTIFFGGIVLFLVFLTSRLVMEITKFINDFHTYSRTFREALIGFLERIQNLYFSIDYPDHFIYTIEENANQLFDFIKSASGQLLEFILNFLSSLPSFLILLAFALMAIYFICRDKDIIFYKIKKIIPGNGGEKLELLSNELSKILIGFLRAQLILTFITMVQVYIGLLLLRVDFALSMSIVVGIVDIIPVIGPGAVFLPWAAWELFINKKLGFALALLVLYTIVSAVRQILQPKVVGDNIGLHPLESLISIYGGLKVFGVLGVVIGPILWVFIKVLWRTNLLNKNIN